MFTDDTRAHLDRYILGMGNYAQREQEICNCCGEFFAYHPRLVSNGYGHCPTCLGVEGIDPDTIEVGAFD